jgi:hypothetical protein
MTLQLDAGRRRCIEWVADSSIQVLTFENESQDSGHASFASSTCGAYNHFFYFSSLQTLKMTGGAARAE